MGAVRLIYDETARQFKKVGHNSNLPYIGVSVDHITLRDEPRFQGAPAPDEPPGILITARE